MLGEGLAGTGVAGRPIEYFNPGYVREFMKQESGSGILTYISRVMEAGTTANGVFGAKLHWYQLEEWHSHLLAAPGYREITVPEVMPKFLPHLRYVWLTRHDKARQAISLSKAIQSGTWWVLDGGTEQCGVFSGEPINTWWMVEEIKARHTKQAVAKKELRFDYHAIETLERHLIEQEARWRQYFAECGVTPLRVIYEDLVGDYEVTVRDVLEHLQIPVLRNLVIAPPRLRKLSDTVSEDWVCRYANLKRTA